MDRSSATAVSPVPLVEELVAHRDALFAFLLVLTRDRDVAEELVQEVGACVLEEARRGARPQAFAPWLRGIARHRAADWYRRRAHAGGAIAGFDRLADAVERAFDDAWIEAEEAAERVRALRACIARLAPTARAMIDARYREGLGHDDIARRHGWKASAVKVALAKARHALLGCLARKRVTS
jgi:RNA polymerase sigma-70 factor (ECF subfamily)